MKNLQELVDELERQKTTKRDIVVDSRQLRASAEEGNGDITLSVPMPDNEGSSDLRLTEHAHAQLSNKTGIPKRYYDRMRESGRGELLANNVNAWIETRDRRLIRTMDGEVRAILSDRYKVMDNYDLTFTALDEFGKVEAQIHKCSITETYMYIKAILPHSAQEIRTGDKVVPGVIVKNSEVGAGRLAVEPFFLRQICTNGMIGEASVSKIHLGKRMELGQILSDETKELECKAVFSVIRDVIHATFDEKVYMKWFDSMREAANEDIENPINAVGHVVKDYTLSQEQKSELMARFSTGKDYTVWGLANSVTNSQSSPFLSGCLITCRTFTWLCAIMNI